ncbi:hypothetical protein [Paracoccus albicereus]|uniref:hypothetical protein n=1 Tax=Paracoccus albicereus TaxID=2922394 RepID=UPI002100864D|nr:hypothetical protein [Paracoccus albicereus]
MGRNIGQFDIPRSVPNLIISPGIEVPDERQPGRLRIFVDDKGWIARAECE